MTEKELQRYIIKRFIWTTVIIAVVEFIMLFTLINDIIPLVLDNVFPELQKVTTFSEFRDLPGSSEWIVVLCLLGVIIMALLPLVTGGVVFSGRVTRKLKAFEAQREKERAQEQKQRYLMISDIAHDLKTPMTTVSGYAKALSDGMVKEDQQKEYLDAISDKTLRMNDIVQMLFDYVRLDSEGFTLAKQKTDICELVRECVAANFSDIEAAGDEVDVDIPDDQIMINADKVQLTRVFNNLITNAVKHNPKGTKLGVYVKAEPDEVRVYIADTGAPIEEELAKELFEPFVMGDKSRSTGGGSGLGLSVANKIAELHRFKLKLVQRPEMQRYNLGEDYMKVFLLICALQ